MRGVFARERSWDSQDFVGKSRRTGRVTRQVPAMPKEVDEVFCRQQEETPQLLDLVFIGDFSHLDCCRVSSIIDYAQSRKFLVCVSGSWCRCFMSWVEGIFCWTCWCSKNGKNYLNLYRFTAALVNRDCGQKGPRCVRVITLEFERADSGLLNDLLERIA